MSNLDNYKSELNNIHAPEALIQRTLLMVHEEEARFEAEKDTDQLTNNFSSMDKAEGGMTSANYKPAKVSFFSKYKAPIKASNISATIALRYFPPLSDSP